jgi:hypothetical protein
VQLSLDNDANPARELSDRSKFNVVIIYEDCGTGRRAKYFYENLVQELKGKCDFNLQLWSFQVLAFQRLGIGLRESQPRPISSFFPYTAKLDFRSRFESGLKLGRG